MQDFNEPQTCSKCGSPEHVLFAAEYGQGLRCMDCPHELVVCKAQTKRHKKRFKLRMTEAWTAQKKRKSF